jgi:hypothetical protein
MTVSGGDRQSGRKIAQEMFRMDRNSFPLTIVLAIAALAFLLSPLAMGCEPD